MTPDPFGCPHVGTIKPCPNCDCRRASSATDLLEALIGVVRVADRKTAEFDAARAAIAKATGQ